MTEPKALPRKPRLADIAKAAGVSIATVSRVLDDHPAIKPDTKAKVRAVAQTQNYPLRDVAEPKQRKVRIHKPRRLGSICVVLPAALPVGARLANSFEVNLLGGIGAAMRDNGLDLSISAQAPHDDKSLISFMASHPYDGIIFFGQSQFHGGLNELAQGPRPFVVWGVEAPDQRYCSIGTDNFAGGMIATNHLIRQGRRRIAFVGQAAVITSAQTRLSQSAARLAGYRAAGEAAELPSDMAMITSASTGRQAGIDGVDRLMRQGIAFDAIVANSDMAAIGAIRALSLHGLDVPHDVAVVGYDDSEVASLVQPALTSVRQDIGAAGSLLVGKLLRAMSGYQIKSERLPTELVIRESCGAWPAA